MYIDLEEIENYQSEEDKIKQAEMTKFIDEFVMQFKNRFDIIPFVTIEPKKDNKLVRGLPLSELMRIINNRLYVNNPKFFPTGIKTNTREKAVVLHRYIYFTLARNMRYTLNEIGESVGKNHATIIHGVRQLSNLLDAGIYPDVNDPYYECTKEVNERIFGPGSVQPVPEAGLESESDVHVAQL